MSHPPVDLFLFTHAHWFYWAITVAVILGSMTLLNVTRSTPKREYTMSVHTSVYDLLETGQVDQNLDTDTLLLIQELIVKTVDTLQQEPKWGQAGQNAVEKYNALLEQIQQVLNKRFGVDGMTPIS